MTGSRWIVALGALTLGASAASSVAATGCTALAGLNGYEIVGGAGGATGGGGSGASGGATGGGGSGAQAGGGAGGECHSPSECPGQDETCRYRSCVAGQCGMTNAGIGTSCGGDATHVCDGAGQCKLGLGQACSGGDGCASSHCVDGVCCDTECTETCQACSAEKTGGTDGTCASVLPFTDPDSECLATPALGCSSNGVCAACGDSAPGPGPDLPCPTICSGGCDDGTCTITASTANEFNAQTIDCPPDYACVIECSADHACFHATINCPANYPCSLTCTSGNHKCDTATVNCPDKGLCTLLCEGGDTCTTTHVNCGQNVCSASCPSGGQVPTLSGCGACDCSNTC